MGLKVEPGRTDSVVNQRPQPREKVDQSTVFWVASSLSTLAVTGTCGLFYCLFSGFRFASWLLMPKADKKWPPLPKAGADLAEPEVLKQIFRQDPMVVIEKLKVLLDDDPDSAMLVLFNLAREGLECGIFKALLAETFLHAPSVLVNKVVSLCVEEPCFAQDFVLEVVRENKAYPYDSQNIESRKEFIGLCNGVFKDFFLTKEMRAFLKQAHSEDLHKTMDDLIYVGLESSCTEENLREVSEFNGLYEEYKRIDESVIEFWSGCIAFILEHGQQFSGLNLTCREEHIHGEETSTFGDFVERLLFVRMKIEGESVPAFNPLHLLSTPIFDQWMGLLDQFISYTQEQRLGNSQVRVLENYPKLAELFQSLKELIKSKSQGRNSPYEMFRSLVTKIIDVYYPSGKSPKK